MTSDDYQKYYRESTLKFKKKLFDLKNKFFMKFGVEILEFIINKYFVIYTSVNLFQLMKLFIQIIVIVSLNKLGRVFKSLCKSQ